jgi:hypothetical protein
LLNPAGSGNTRDPRAFNEPRAAFYTEKRGKKQNKNVRLRIVRKISSRVQTNATASKKAGNGVKK